MSPRSTCHHARFSVVPCPVWEHLPRLSSYVLLFTARPAAIVPFRNVSGPCVAVLSSAMLGPYVSVKAIITLIARVCISTSCKYVSMSFVILAANKLNASKSRKCTYACISVYLLNWQTHIGNNQVLAFEDLNFATCVNGFGYVIKIMSSNIVIIFQRNYVDVYDNMIIFIRIQIKHTCCNLKHKYPIF